MSEEVAAHACQQNPSLHVPFLQDPCMQINNDVIRSVTPPLSESIRRHSHFFSYGESMTRRVGDESLRRLNVKKIFDVLLLIFRTFLFMLSVSLLLRMSTSHIKVSVSMVPVVSSIDYRGVSNYSQVRGHCLRTFPVSSRCSTSCHLRWNSHDGSSAQSQEMLLHRDVFTDLLRVTDVLIPLGWKTAIQSFQRVMHETSSPHAEFVFVFVDDIARASVSWVSHLTHLDKVFLSFVRVDESLSNKFVL